MLLAVALRPEGAGGRARTVWLVSGLSVISGLQMMLVQLAVVFTAFGTARWGRPATVVLSGLSMPVAAVIAAVVPPPRRGRPRPAALSGRLRGLRAGRSGRRPVVGGADRPLRHGGARGALAGRAGPALPRPGQESRASQVAAEEDAARAELATEQAREIAAAARGPGPPGPRRARRRRPLARGDPGPGRVGAVPRRRHRRGSSRPWRTSPPRRAPRCRTSARCSRRRPGHRPSPGSLRRADRGGPGQRTRGRRRPRSGTPQPLPPELEVVAYRVLQEMLTNAIKHGRRDEPVFVERHWEGELRIEVRNVVEPRHRASAGARPGARRHAAAARGGRRPARRTPPRRAGPDRPSPSPRGCRCGRR